jgi:hypothetical protein
MATGFETMRSNYTALLHPAVDPHDSFDPTFIGIKRKRRLPEPKGVETIFRDGGKHIDRTKMKHDPDCFVQHDSTHVPETFKGDTRSTRFGTGFHRRGGYAVVQAPEMSRHERVLEHRRDKAVSKQIEPSSVPTAARLPNIARAAALKNSASSVFSSGTSMSANAVWRQQRLVAEGLTVTKKDWSVRQQMTALDGFPLP